MATRRVAFLVLRGWLLDLWMPKIFLNHLPLGSPAVSDATLRTLKA